MRLLGKVISSSFLSVEIFGFDYASGCFKLTVGAAFLLPFRIWSEIEISIL
jgi:hypothetical protein